MLYMRGWVEYFTTGPQREPFYPMTIAVSMALGDFFTVFYQTFQKFIQIALLGLTQLFCLILLNRLQIKGPWKWLTLFYVGVSPAIVNSAFSLFSEIVVLPFILMIIYANVEAWRSLYIGSMRSLITGSLLTAMAFLLATFGKGVFLYVFYVFLIPYICLAWRAFTKGSRRLCVRTMLFIIITFMIVQIPIWAYKSANRKYNGYFEFTNRADQLLYGNTYKRTADIPWDIFGAHIASIPGTGVCRKFFKEEGCRYAEFRQADGSRGDLTGLLQGVPPEKEKAEVLRFTFQRFLRKPGQYFVLTLIESVRMPFWESSRIGFVAYPDWLNTIFTSGVFNQGIRLLVSLLSVFALFYLIREVGRTGRRRFRVDAAPEDKDLVLFFALLLIIAYTAFYSLFSIIPRYGIVIAPVYLLSIAYAGQQITRRVAKP